jgi:hypothetical protein
MTADGSMWPVRRRAGRPSERGASVFIVVMVLTLLTAMGIFAVRTTSMADVAAGYDREASQAQYLAQYGTLAAAAELGSGTASAYVEKMRSGETCRANYGVDLTLTPIPLCYKLFMSELGARTMADSSNGILDPASLTPASNTLVGDFVVEMTDPGPAGSPIAGTDVGGTGTSFRYTKVSLTTTAQVRPFDGSAACTQAGAASAGQQTVRAHVVIGPLPP